MFLTESLSPDNQSFFKAWEEHTPGIVEATIVGELVSRDWHFVEGEKLLKCSFKILGTELTVSLLALPYEVEGKTIYSPQEVESDWSVAPQIGEYWRITIRSGYKGSYMWLSAREDKL